jgi:hypothetical protein
MVYTGVRSFWIAYMPFLRGRITSETEHPPAEERVQNTRVLQRHDWVSSFLMPFTPSLNRGFLFCFKWENKNGFSLWGFLVKRLLSDKAPILKKEACKRYGFKRFKLRDEPRIDFLTTSL